MSTTFAGQIAAKLQGAHARRRRNEREDEDVDENIWDDTHLQDIRSVVMDALAQVYRAGTKAAPGDPQASAVSAERVVELERQLAESHRTAEEWRRSWSDEHERAEDLSKRASEFYELLATAYVAREVPWADVAAGMMTIARDGTPWMVVGVTEPVWTLQNKTDVFTKTPKPGETVRVLVPYVTPEAAEGLVREQLGGVPLDQDPVHGTEVGS